MTFLFDTNILVYYITNPGVLTDFETSYQPFSNKNVSIISIVTEAEIRSIAIQRNWGSKKLEILNRLFQQFLRIPIQTEKQVAAYALIDAYSQGKHPNYTYPVGFTSRNMGKNDLWIAATAYVVNAKLVTADGDFDHLDKTMIDMIKLKLA